MPKVSNYESVDSIVPPDKVFQMTVSHEHPVKMKHLKEIKNILKCNDLKLYFVVPEDIYVDFQQQPYHTQRKKVSRCKMKCVSQWALCVPIKVSVGRNSSNI